MKTLFITILSLLLLSASCKKNKKCSRGYDLEHPVSVYPIKESYNIGDTIWFEMNFSDIFNALVTDNYNGGAQHYQSIQLKNFDFHRTSFSFYELIDASLGLGGQNNNTNSFFDSILELGAITYFHPNGPEFRYLYINNTYKFKFGLICLQTGHFVFRPAFGHYYPISEGQLNEQDLTPECETEIITDIRFPVNKQSNGTYLTNYHLFEQFMNPDVENDLDRIKNECFTFVVN